MLSTACPKPVKRSTVKAKQRRRKGTNIGTVRERVFDRDATCRLVRALGKAGAGVLFYHLYAVSELAHVVGRGQGGADTTQNTLRLAKGFHQGPFSHHSGHIKIRPLTERGADGPCCFEIYETLPTEIR